MNSRDGEHRRREALVITALYTTLLAIVSYHHEPWFDEAQAWLLARDSSLWQLLGHAVRYEGTPALWHLILILPTRLGLPYESIKFFGGAAAVAGVWIWARHSAVPAPVRWLAPFAFCLFYQFAVVSRSYDLLPPLLFLLASVHATADRHPLRYAILLALLANTSVPGFLIAGSLLIVQNRKVGGRGTLVSLAGLAIAAATAFPPSDDAFARGFNRGLGRLVEISGGILSESMSGFLPLSLLAIGVTLWWLWKRKALALYVIPTLSLLAFFALKYFSPAQEQTLVLVWLFALWVSFDPRVPRDTRSLPAGAARTILLAVAALVLGFQCFWSAATSREEIRGPYSGSRAAAQFLAGRKDRRISAVGFNTVGILPYFDGNIFANLRGGEKPAYWDWSTHPDRRDQPAQILADRPDIVVYGIKSRIADGLGITPDPGYLLRDYRRVVDFPGTLFWKGGVLETDSFEVFERRSADRSKRKTRAITVSGYP